MSAVGPNGPSLDALVAATDAQPKWESGTTPSVRAVAAATKFLREDGYQIAFRHGGFCDCLVAREDERWVGRGADEVQALIDALRRMFPSRLAWDLLGKHVAGGAPPKSTHVEQQPAPVEPQAPIAIAAPAVDVRPAPKRPPTAAPPKYAVSDALTALAELRREIEASRSELARLAPARQRLRVQSWICRARVHQEKLPGLSDLHRAVSEIARDLTALCRLYWPGSVRALQSTSTPSTVVPRASTWAEAAEHARALDRPDASSKLDRDGWADADKLAPPPAKPEIVLHEVVTLLEDLTGPLGAARPALPSPAAAASPQVLLAAAKLRWLRTSRCSTERWAQALGRMRWLAAETGQAMLQGRLDPAFVPSGSWESLIRGAPASKTR